jgi:tryptophan synthase alpha chain
MISNRLTELFDKKERNILNIYFTAGYPKLNDTVTIIKELERSGCDLVEVGIPYSDPLADGPTIQESGTVALKNGLTLETIFTQIAEARRESTISIVLMGYVNQLMQYGVERFVKRCSEVGVDGLIIPDLPPEIYDREYRKLFEKSNLTFTFLVTPQTSDKRIEMLDKLSTGFLYIVSSASITGGSLDVGDRQVDYFKRVESLNLTSSRLIGFGSSDADSFNRACSYANGAIIGSAFIRSLTRDGINGISNFVKSIIG